VQRIDMPCAFSQSCTVDSSPPIASLLSYGVKKNSGFDERCSTNSVTDLILEITYQKVSMLW
jgi:hypothetical protein